MSEIDCPRAKSWMTPCIARDGRTALADDGMCVGCGHEPYTLLLDLATRYSPAGDVRAKNAAEAADALQLHVKGYVDRPQVHGEPRSAQPTLDRMGE